MSAGSGGPTPDQVVSMSEANLRTALEIERANTSAWVAIANARAQTITQLQLCLDRYQKRTPN